MSGMSPVDVLAENPLLHYSTIISYPGGVRKCRLLVKLVGIVMIRLIFGFTVLYKFSQVTGGTEQLLGFLIELCYTIK